MSTLESLSDRISARRATGARYRLNPALYEELSWTPCTLSLLIVADDFLYFSDGDFGLSELISILKNENRSYVQFNITVAHRGSPTSAQMGIENPDIFRHINSFRFDDGDDFNPAAFDQIWLFGSARSRRSNSGDWSGKLTDAELRILMEFMDAGGGIFATGDHEDLGCAMGGFLPRVRQMRRWFFPDPGPNGEGLAPPIEGRGRFDTNRVGHDAGYQFNDQSDDIPQPIFPKVYSRKVGPFREASYPHPVLCGQNGTIRVLPDHPHESQCTTAANPNASETLDGETFTEFKPAIDGGARPLPEIIATSIVIGGHATSGKTGNTVSRTFGAIAAYDGHRARVGRIVTDATWHHFINVNLTGENGTAGDKGIGFLASPTGQLHLAEIASYFVNIALWISPTQKLRCMRNWGLLVVIMNHRLAEVFDPRIQLGNARLVDFLVLGRHARDAIGKLAGECESLRWTWDFVREAVEDVGIFVDVSDPWRPEKEGDDHESPFLDDLAARDLVDLDWVGDVALGGAVMALRQQMMPLEQAALDRFDETGDRITRDGAEAAMKLALPFAERSLTELARTGFRQPEKRH